MLISGELESTFRGISDWFQFELIAFFCDLSPAIMAFWSFTQFTAISCTKFRKTSFSLIMHGKICWLVNGVYDYYPIIKFTYVTCEHACICKAKIWSISSHLDVDNASIDRFPCLIFENWSVATYILILVQSSLNSIMIDWYLRRWRHGKIKVELLVVKLCMKLL